METKKVLIADNTDVFPQALSAALEPRYQVCVCGDGNEALDLMHRFQPDILVLDLLIPGLDGISLLQSAAEAGICPMVLAIAPFQNDYILESMDRLHVEYLMTRPCDILHTVQRIDDLRHRICPPAPSPRELRQRISDALIALHIPANLCGFSYLLEAIASVYQNPNQALTKELYPSLAAKFQNSSNNVERDIRTVIQAGWANRDSQSWQICFPPRADGQIPRPTNAQFIRRLVMLLRP